MSKYMKSTVIVALFSLFFSALLYSNAYALFSKDNTEEQVSPIIVDDEANKETVSVKKTTALDRINIESKTKPEDIQAAIEGNVDEEGESTDGEQITEEENKQLSLMFYNQRQELIKINSGIEAKMDSIHQELRYLMGLNIIFILLSFVIFKKAFAKRRTFY